MPQSDPDGVLRPIVRKNDKEQKISRAMKSYLARAANTEKFLAGKREEFELGKRHLANIMGWNPDEISQEDIDVSDEASVCDCLPCSQNERSQNH